MVIKLRSDRRVGDGNETPFSRRIQMDSLQFRRAQSSVNCIIEKKSMLSGEKITIPHQFKKTALREKACTGHHSIVLVAWHSS
jgi:hypothetical protein